MSGTLMQNGEVKGTSVRETQTSCANAGADKVTVPLGTFNSFEITCHTTVSITDTLNGITGQPNLTTQDVTQWYVLGIGLVKSVSAGDGGNETIQLNNYNIPIICRGYTP